MLLSFSLFPVRHPGADPGTSHCKQVQTASHCKQVLSCQARSFEKPPFLNLVTTYLPHCCHPAPCLDWRWKLFGLELHFYGRGRPRPMTSFWPMAVVKMKRTWPREKVLRVNAGRPVLLHLYRISSSDKFKILKILGQIWR